MVVDTYETFDENLERIFSENICPTYEKYTRSQKTDVFLTCFREHMVPSTWRGKVTRTDNVSHDLRLWTRNKNSDRYREFLVCIYCIPNEIISSTLVYDQDANRSRGFILVALGAPLNFIAMLYSVFPICGNIDLYLDPFQELLKERFTLQALHWSTD